MRTDQRQILSQLNCGRITISEAETLLDLARHGNSSIFPIRSRITSRIKGWVGDHMGSWLTLALLAGIGLRPAFAAALDAGVQTIGGLTGLHLFFNRLMEAFL